MPQEVIVVAGASGELGSRVVRELLLNNALVRALKRGKSPIPNLEPFRNENFEIIPVDFGNLASLVTALEGASVVISTVAGLRDVIIGTQSTLLEAAIRAGVPRFIPSDFAIDFTKLPPGSNRNLNLREEFREILDRKPIRSTSVLNGAFMDMLTGTAPFILFKLRRILCWGDPDQPMDWTTIADTAKYTALAAMDHDAPRFLRIAGEELTARGLQNLMSELTGYHFGLLRPGGLGVLKTFIQITKAFSPDNGDVYPPWQGMQYMHNLYSGLAKFDSLDNDRYSMTWTKAQVVLANHIAKLHGKSQGVEQI